jgi:adenosylcobinamide-GDP ribazoletransferase
MMNGLRSAIGFLTILPLAPSGGPASMASARGWFPLVGLLLGLILAGFDILRMLMLQAGSSGWYGGYAPLPTTYPVFPDYTILLWSVLLVVILVVLTRALHLDGFMDSCDALLGGFDRERRLAILRDPNVGAFAVIGVVCLLLIKVLAIAELPPAILVPPGIAVLPPEGWSVRIPMLLLFPCLSRWAVLLTMELYPYVRSNGIGTAFFGGEQRRVRWQLMIGFAFTMVISVALAGMVGIVLLAAACAVAWGIGAWATRLLGGVTGDIYGAVNELTEVVVLLMALMLMAVTPFTLYSPLIEAVWSILQ